MIAIIDLESPLFTEIAGALRSEYKGVTVYGEYVPAPAGFPSVSIVEMDNSTFLPTWSNRATEQYAFVMYEVNVYSNLTEGKKAQAKAIMDTIDTMLQEYGFERITVTPVQNMNDATIYRMVGRYRAVVGDDLTVYRR